MALVPPAKGMEDQLGMVDDKYARIQGTQPSEMVKAMMMAAQVNATCALVHAVRELTAEVRALREDS